MARVSTSSMSLSWFMEPRSTKTKGRRMFPKYQFGLCSFRLIYHLPAWSVQATCILVGVREWDQELTGTPFSGYDSFAARLYSSYCSPLIGNPKNNGSDV